MQPLSPRTQAPSSPPGQRNYSEARAYGAPLGTHRYPPLPGDTQPTPIKTKNKSLKANINVATLNVNGYAAPSQSMTGIEKWSTIYQTMKENRIAILALQETHLDGNLLHSVNECFGSRITIVNSELPENPRSSAGVAFAINRTLVVPKELQTLELIEGRALAIKFKWHNDNDILIINVYAPNNRSEHPDFWERVDTQRRAKGLRRPDMMLGDFNLTEEPIDRAPARLDDIPAIEALRNMRQCLGLEDSWRHAFPHDRNFTYRANTNEQAIKSRLDRIYTSKDTTKTIYDWKFTQTSVPTDHWMVSVKYTAPQAPFIGKGRWTMQIPAIQNGDLIDKIIDRGMILKTDLSNLSNDPAHGNIRAPQVLWAKFKEDIAKLAKKHCAESRGKLASKMRKIESKLENLAKDPQIDTNNTLRADEAFLAKDLAILKRIVARDKKDDLRAAIANHGEVLGGVWTSMNKERKPRDILYRLKVPGPPTDSPRYERDTRRMAKLARDYHEALQVNDIAPLDPPDWAARTGSVLDEVREAQRLTEHDLEKTDWLITYPQVWNALRLAKNGTATGLDGCPYELWKELDNRHREAQRLGITSFDIVEILTVVFNNIQFFGLEEDSQFASGWMCPIYKKKDPTDIANYRPITLLNTDYKIMTKTLALQIVEAIHKMIHPDQAGFIPKRSIFNHIRLASTIINYAEVMEVDGVIVALDQEKAYDKIRHDYLWKTLDTFNLPNLLINTVRSLYENAFTQVAINGVLSSPFKVTRGVRQGDPLSCLLFDLAIEPLACMMRNSDNLEGLTIPGVEGKVIVNLFADDTTVYLNNRDRFDKLQEILSRWCEVSGAKFNIEKTEIIPIGTEAHRISVTETRKINPDDTSPLDSRIHIAADGEAVRSLGAWIGNKTNDLTPWEVVLDKINKKLNIWSRSHPTLYGKRLIVQAVVGGHTQFLTKAQGMPPHIEDALTKVIRDFVWDNDTRPRIAMEYLHAPLKHGGLNLLDIKARNDAIELVWLRDYLNLTPSRQTWAIVTDILINATAPPGSSAVAITNAFLQSWNPPTRGPRLALLNDGIIRMLKAARTYKTNLAAIRLSPGVQAALPAWYHPCSESRSITNVSAKCLLNNHNAKTVADLVKLANKAQAQERNRNHVPDQACVCIECVHSRQMGCKNPHACALEAKLRISDIAPKYNPLTYTHHDTLSLTPDRKARNEEARIEGKGIAFDPSITCKDGIAECFRVFTDPRKLPDTPATRRPQQGSHLDHVDMRVYTDGSCINNGKADAACGSGVWVAVDHPKNKAIKIPGPHQSNQVGEIGAIVVAAETLPNYCNLTIVTDSRYVIDGLTKHLRQWEDNGWIEVENAELFKRAAYLLKKRTAPTYFEWVKGHQGDQGNEESDKLAKEGASKNTPDPISLHIPKDFDLQGAKLATLTQALAYRGIRRLTPQPQRAITNRNIDLAREAIKTVSGALETTGTIWKSIRKRSIRLRVQQFLFKAIHNTPMIGDFWFNIEGYHLRGMCVPCEAVENMDHILTTCGAGKAPLIWNLAREMWPYDTNLWPEITLGLILGSGCLSVKTTPRQREHAQTDTHSPIKNARGASRLLQILISEAAHLAWVLRCERVIQEVQHTDEEAKKRWYKAINRRLTDDKITATVIKREPPFTQLVEATWEDVLKKSSDPPTGWINHREVLVGMSEG